MSISTLNADIYDEDSDILSLYNSGYKINPKKRKRDELRREKKIK